MDVRSRSQGLDRLDSHLSGHAAIGPRQSRLCLGRRNAVRARRARCVFRCRPCVSLRSWAKFSARWAEFSAPQSALLRSRSHIVDAVTQAMYWAIFLSSTLRTACGGRWQAHPLQLQCLAMVSRRPGADSTRTAALTDQVNVIFCPWLGLARSCTDLRWTS